MGLQPNTIAHIFIKNPGYAVLVINDLKLLEGLNSYVDYPAEINPSDKILYLLSLMYPKRYYQNMKRDVTNLYENILSSDETVQFPRDFFIGKRGFQRFAICLEYWIQTAYDVKSDIELYDLVTNSRFQDDLIKCSRLGIPMDLFNIDLLSALKEFGNESLYYLYDFDRSFGPSSRKELLNEDIHITTNLKLDEDDF